VPAPAISRITASTMAAAGLRRRFGATGTAIGCQAGCAAGGSASPSILRPKASYSAIGRS
jgi:hypothetical protein